MNIKPLFNLIRKFAPAVEKAVYNKQTAPNRVKLIPSKDLLHLHWNDGPFGENIANGFKVAQERFNKAPHGIVARMGESPSEPNSGLSHDSAPLFYALGTRWTKQGKAKFVTIKGEPEMVQVNTIPTKKTGKNPVFTQDYVDKLIKQIQEINQLQGTNFPLPELRHSIPQAALNAKKAGDMEFYRWILNRNPEHAQVFIPNIGLLKFNKGGTIRTRNNK